MRVVTVTSCTNGHVVDCVDQTVVALGHVIAVGDEFLQDGWSAKYFKLATTRLPFVSRTLILSPASGIG